MSIVHDARDTKVFDLVEAPWASRLIELRSLSAGWLDGQGEPIADAALECAERILEAAREAELPMPAVFPTPPGGVQLEYLDSKRHLEVGIAPDVSIEGYYLDVGTHEEHEEELATVAEAIWFMKRW